MFPSKFFVVLDHVARRDTEIGQAARVYAREGRGDAVEAVERARDAVVALVVEHFEGVSDDLPVREPDDPDTAPFVPRTTECYNAVLEDIDVSEVDSIRDGGMYPELVAWLEADPRKDWDAVALLLSTHIYTTGGIAILPKSKGMRALGLSDRTVDEMLPRALELYNEWHPRNRLVDLDVSSAHAEVTWVGDSAQGPWRQCTLVLEWVDSRVRTTVIHKHLDAALGSREGSVASGRGEGVYIKTVQEGVQEAVAEAGWLMFAGGMRRRW